MPRGVTNQSASYSLYSTLLAAGANANAATILTAIAGAETGYGTKPNNNNNGYGPFNIPAYYSKPPYGTTNNPRYDISRSNDLTYNAIYAWQHVSFRGTSYLQWNSFLSGKYRNFLPTGVSPFIPPDQVTGVNQFPGATQRGTTGQNVGSGQSQGGPTAQQITQQAFTTAFGAGFIVPNASGGVNYTPQASFTKPPITLAPTASVTSFLNNIDQFQQLINPANVVGIPDITILGYDTQFQNPIDWFEGFFFNLMADFGAFIVDAILVITGVVMCWKVVNAVTDVQGKIAGAASIAGQGIALGALL